MIRYSLVLLLGMAAPALAQTEPAHPNPTILLPPDIHWSGKPGSTQSVTVLGDSRKPGPFVTVMNWASGSISKPHYHLKSRTFIVLKGHWDFGSGPKFDLASMKALPEGSVVTVPAGGILYDGCKQAPCETEIIGDGDDPEFMVDERGKTIPPGQTKQ
jgi:hypothetical protein